MSSGKCNLNQQDIITHLLAWPKSRTLTTSNPGEDVEQQDSHPLLVGMQNGSGTLSDSLVFLSRVNVLLSHDPGIIPLDIYPEDLKTYVHTKTYTWMFIAALFMIAKTWKQAKLALPQ